MTASVDGGLSINGTWWFPQHDALGGNLSGTYVFENGKDYSSAFIVTGMTFYRGSASATFKIKTRSFGLFNWL